ncbi:MAG: ImmA/IrrE family metallo-endopeptidase [Pseudomonadota bacterium]|nr:ImmA/IrrE family metallo-endopeptidase [Pseudomonadota bacterium]
MSLEKIFREHAGPPVNIEGIIRDLGIKLDKRAALDPEISGQCERLDDGTFKISVNKSDHYYRQRFTMAHELGHFLFHSHLLEDGVDDNRAYRSTADGRFFNRLIGPAQESEANRFAANVLMPRDLVAGEWKRLGNLLEVSKRFQVSKPAMQIRLRTLGIEVEGAE